MSSTESAGRYVAGHMDEEEERQFEERLLEQPELAADVDLRHRIKLGLQTLEENGELGALVARPAPRSHWTYALAACVLLALGATVAYWQMSTGARVAIAGSLAALRGGASQPISSSYILASTRARAEDTVVTAAADGGAVRLRIVLESGLSQAFVATLSALSGSGEKVVAERVPLESAGNGLVEVFLDPAELQPGRYVLRLEPAESGAGDTEEFSFALNVKP